MPTKDVLSDEEITHPLNEKLLGEAEEIKAERRTLRDRLAKLDESKASVSEAVYQKVRGDYQTQLSKTTERLVTLKRDLETEERGLIEKKNAVEANIQYHREKIEESSLRHSLGEFSPDQHKELTEREQREIERLTSSLKALHEGLERHQKIFEGEDLPPRPAERRPPEPSMPPPASAKPAEPSIRPPQPAAAPVPQPPKKQESSVSYPSYASSAADSTAKIRLDALPRDAEVSGATERSQTAPRKVSELVVLEDGKVVQTVPLDHTIVIGRSPANDVVLKEPKVSRKHAEIQFVGGRYVLLDLESSNGTYIGGKRVSEQVLQPNDEIMIGNTKMVFKG